jgi:hypothetical protein
MNAIVNSSDRQKTKDIVKDAIAPLDEKLREIFQKN